MKPKYNFQSAAYATLGETEHSGDVDSPDPDFLLLGH